MSRKIAAAVLALGLANAIGALADVTPTRKCVATKLKAAGNEVARKMTCHAKAKARSVSVDSACLGAAQAKADARIDKAGTADCAGTAAAIDAAVDSCVGAFLGDAPGDGTCPAASAKAAGKAGGGLLRCEARSVTRPGTLGTCDANNDGRLANKLTKAGGCVAFDAVHADVHACDDRVKAVVVPPAPTTSTSSPAASSSTTSTSSSTSSTSGIPVCGNDVKEGGETCDGTDAAACQGLCLADCTCPPPMCGNGVIEQGEACDGSATTCIPGLLDGCEACQCCIAEGDACGLGPESCCSPAQCHFIGPGFGICTTVCMPSGGPCGAGFPPCCFFPCGPGGICP